MAQERGPAIGEALLTRLGASADVYVQKFDLTRDGALLIQFDADSYRAASFLDDRILTRSTKGGWVALGRLIEAARGVQSALPVHFIFHTGHVGSTLVSRLIDEAAPVLSLREPLTLRLLAEAHDAAGRPDSLLSDNGFGILIETLLRLWSRGFVETRAVVVKATSSAGRIAAELLKRRPEARAITLNLAPEPYLATLLAGPNTPTDLRGHGPERMRRLLAGGIAPPAPLHQMSLGELAAMSWLAESVSAHAAQASGGGRVIAVDFDRLLANVGEEMARILRHLGLTFDAGRVAALAQSLVLTRYAKAPEHAYTPQLRAQILADSRARNSAEIGKGMAWLARMASSHAGARALVDGARA